MNINRILFLLIAVLSVQQACVSSMDLEDLQGLTPTQKRSAFELVDSLSGSLNGNQAKETPPTFYHLISEISENGSTVTLVNGSTWNIGWWNRSTSQKWRVGDRLKVYIEEGSFKLKNVETQTIVPCDVNLFPGSKEIITISRKVSPSRLELSNGFILSSKQNDKLPIHEVGNRVFIFHTSQDMLYYLYNVEKKEFLICSITSYAPPTPSDQPSNEPLISKVLGLEDQLNKRVLQQEDAAHAVHIALLNYVAGLKPKEKPIGVFLFLGPTGVGKTELAKSLTEELFGNRDNLIRFDMSHFSSYHTVDRLIGSPQGYRDHEEGGQLTEPIRNKPQSIVLLDEMEKAHPTVHKFFLPVFDEGFILDNNNEPVDCTQVIFIMTSNLCGREIADLYELGYTPDEILENIESNLMDALSPELYNRVEPVLFRPLERSTMHALIDLLLGQLAEQLKRDKNMTLMFEETTKEYLFQNGFHPLLGARPMKKLIEKRIVSLLALAIVKEEIVAKDRINICYDEESDVFYLKLMRPKPAKVPAPT